MFRAGHPLKHVFLKLASRSLIEKKRGSKGRGQVALTSEVKLRGSKRGICPLVI
jgi:hypothetical protein